MPTDRTPPIPERIAAVGVFNLDDVCAVVREQPAGERTRNQGPELEDPNTAQGPSWSWSGASLELRHGLPHIGLDI